MKLTIMSSNVGPFGKMNRNSPGSFEAVTAQPTTEGRSAPGKLLAQFKLRSIGQRREFPPTS